MSATLLKLQVPKLQNSSYDTKAQGKHRVYLVIITSLHREPGPKEPTQVILEVNKRPDL